MHHPYTSSFYNFYYKTYAKRFILKKAPISAFFYFINIPTTAQAITAINGQALYLHVIYKPINIAIAIIIYVQVISLCPSNVTDDSQGALMHCIAGCDFNNTDLRDIAIFPIVATDNHAPYISKGTLLSQYVALLKLSCIPKFFFTITSIDMRNSINTGKAKLT